MAQTRRIARHGGIALGISLRLELAEAPPGATAAGVATVEEISGVGREHIAAAVRPALAFEQGLRPKVAQYGMLAHPQRLGHGSSGLTLLGEGPALLMESQPPHLALVAQLLGHPWWRWRWHWDGHRAVGSRPRDLAECLIDGMPGVALRMNHLVEGFGEVLHQVNANRDLDRVGGALPSPIHVGSKPITGNHADAGMGLY